MGLSNIAPESTRFWTWLYWLILSVVILFGFHLRFDGLGEPSLWHDEILHIFIGDLVRQEPPSSWLLGLDSDQENGILYYGSQHLARRLVPGETGVRLVPAIVGAATLPLMALAGFLVSGRLLSLAATFLLAVSPLHVFFSRDGRPYAIIMFMALVMLLLLLRPAGRWRIPLAYATCIAAPYVGVMSAPILGSFGLLAGLNYLTVLWRGRSVDPDDEVTALRKVYLHYILAATCGIALIAILYISQDRQYSPSFLGSRSTIYTSALSQRALRKFVASMSTSGVGWTSIQTRSVLFFGLAALGVGVGLWRRHRRGVLLVTGMFLLPALASALSLIAMGRFYGMRYTSSALPAFLLLVGLGVCSLARTVAHLVPAQLGNGTVRKIGGWALMVVMLLAIAGPNVAIARTQSRDKLDWRGLAHFFQQTVLDGEQIVVSGRWPKMCLGFYLNQMSRKLPVYDAAGSVEKAEAIVSSADSVWLVTAGARRSGSVRKWMHSFDQVMSKHQFELDVFFAPDFKTMLRSRFAAGRGDVLLQVFRDNGYRFDFESSELLLQGSGWSFVERNREGVSFQWATDPEAELGLPIDSPKDYRIRFRALPFAYPDASSQSVEVVLNSKSLAVIELEQGWSEHEVLAPADSWVRGSNLLVLRFDRTVSPAQVIPGSGDRRPLSAAFDFLEVLSTDGS